MSAAVKLREDVSASELRALARASRDSRQCRRLLALAAVAEKRPRTEAAALGGMDRQTLRDWVHRFNAEGPDGLLDRKLGGRPSKLTAAQKEELAGIVQAGPDREKTGLVRWRRVDLKAEIEERFGVVYSARAVSQLLWKLGFSHISARPYHPAQKATVLEDFKKTSRAP
jgi:transposase